MPVLVTPGPLQPERRAGDARAPEHRGVAVAKLIERAGGTLIDY